MYLTAQAFGATFGFIAERPAGTSLIFDYAVDRGLLPALERRALWMLETRVARVGEPFRTFFQPADLAARLAGAGFVSIADLGRDQLNARYFSGRADNLRVSGTMGRLVIARR